MTLAGAMTGAVTEATDATGIGGAPPSPDETALDAGCGG